MNLVMDMVVRTLGLMVMDMVVKILGLMVMDMVVRSLVPYGYGYGDLGNFSQNP